MTEPLHKAEDVTEADLKVAEEVYTTWFENEDKIDWEDFLDYMARMGDRYDFEEYDSPAIRKIQRHVRRIKNEFQ